MIRRFLRYRSLLNLLLCFWMTGCGGAGPLRFNPKPKLPGPWCGPGQRARVGERVVGTVGFGENKWKDFLVDEAGNEYDPEKLADQVWSYLERTGDAQNIKDAYRRSGYHLRMVVVSLKPVVVLLETRQDAAVPKQPGPSPGRYFWVAQIHAVSNPVYQDGLQWFSPDLKQRPTRIAFDPAGVAEIPLAPGTLRLIRDGNDCKTTRE